MNKGLEKATSKTSATMFEIARNLPANDKVVPSDDLGQRVNSQDSGTVLTVISNEEITKVGVPLHIGDPGTPSICDISNQRSYKSPFNNGAGPRRSE